MISREAYDLHSQACRRNVKQALRRGMWRHMWWLRLVLADTLRRVCSKRAAPTNSRHTTEDTHD